MAVIVPNARVLINWALGEVGETLEAAKRAKAVFDQRL